MRQLTTEQLARLVGAHESPCISLYMPTHRQHPENVQDPIRYRNLLKKMELSLREQYPIREIRMILERFEALAREDQFWNQRTDGLAIFTSPQRFEMFELQRPIRELLIIADSFHTKPLIRTLQSADRYHVLCLNRHKAELYEGNRDALDSVELTNVPSTIAEVLRDQRSPTTQMVGSYGTRGSGGGTAVHHGHGPQTDPREDDTRTFLRAVDRGIWRHYSQPSGLPLMLVALPESQELLRRFSRNPFLLPVGIETTPDVFSVDQLREQAWQKIEPLYLTRLEELKRRFHEARSRLAGSADFSDVAKAAVAGQIGTLLVEADRVVPGVLDRISGSICIDDVVDLHVDDMLDDLAELVMSKDGEVVVVPTERMPTESGVAAIYRF